MLADATDDIGFATDALSKYIRPPHDLG
jgi:hypothetical protein